MGNANSWFNESVRRHDSGSTDMNERLRRAAGRIVEEPDTDQQADELDDAS